MRGRRAEDEAMTRRHVEIPLAIQVLSGIGGMVLVVGIAMLGISYLDRGTWGSVGDLPARVTTLGVLILLGAALSNAVRGGNGD